MAEIDNKLNDPLNTAPKVPSVSGALGMTQDIARQQVESTKRMGELEAQKLEKLPEIQKEKLEAEKAYRDIAAGKRDMEIAQAEQDMSQFKVSQDSIGGMSALGTAILMLGQALGRSGGQQSAMGAIQGMTGMMQGYTQGRADEFKRNQAEFDRNFKILQDKIKRANDKFQAALTEMPYNTIDAQTKAAQALAELDSPILREKFNKQGLVETAEFVKTLFNASEKAADRAQQLAVAAAKTGKGSDRYGFAEIMSVASNEAAATMRNIMGLPMESTSGIFGGRTTNSLFTAPVDAFANKLTTESTQRYNAQSGKLAYFLAQLVKGGRVVGVQEVAVMDNILKIKEGDTLETAANKLAEARQVAERAMEVRIQSPNTPNELKEIYRENLNTVRTVIPFTVDDINQFVKERDKSTTFGDELKDRYTRPATPAAPAAPTPAAPTGKQKALPGEQVHVDKDGNRAVFRNNQWVEVE